MTVVEQARRIIGSLARHRHLNQEAPGAFRRCNSSHTKADSKTLVGRVGHGLVPLNRCNASKGETAPQAVGMSARFGKYYLEKIANLES
jgi:hypothetical protein